MLIHNEITGIIIQNSIEIHKSLGPGLLESAYVRCLEHSLTKSGLSVHKEFPIPVVYKGMKMDCSYRADLLIENKVIVEIKAVDSINEIHKAQVLTYLRLTDLKLGLLINFNVVLLKDGITRIVNNF